MKTFLFFSLAALTMVTIIFLYEKNQASALPVIFSPETLLSDLWRTYKQSYFDPASGRTIDPSQNGVTTSEGQNYTMLRAAWIDDKATFDASWDWEQAYLEHQNDHLFSWLWGKRSDGTLGILADKGGQNSASDADTDAAVALIFAYSRWHQLPYLVAAQNIAKDIWRYEVVPVQGKPVLAADNVERDSAQTIIVNPSYFEPYAYRMFAAIDPADNWNGLIDNSYSILASLSSGASGASSNDGLPPDWIGIDRTTGAFVAIDAGAHSTDFGFDAMRVPWRIALDSIWYGDPRAIRVLDSYSFLKTQWDSKKIIYATYSPSGTPTVQSDVPAVYGGTMGYFVVADSGDAASVYDLKLRTLFNPDSQSWTQKLSYYDDNWAWFGIALYNKILPNLGSGIASKLTFSPAIPST